jgi:hypothetical protein
VLRLYDHPYTQGIERILNHIEYLMREALLYLQAADIALYHMRQLAEACNNTIGYIGYMCLAKEGQQMMFAKRIEFYVLYQHHFAIVFMKLGRIDDICGIHFITLGYELHRLCHALWRFQQAFAVWVFTYCRNDRRIGRFEVAGSFRIV